MKLRKKSALGMALLCACGMSLVWGSGFAPASPSANLQSPKPMPSASPAYHKHGPSFALPPTLDPREFANDRRAFVAYSLAARIPKILYQQPCFCRCNTFAGHESLFDCFREKHASWCYGCESEAIFCYEKHNVGLGAAKIRKALLRGESKSLDLDQYVRRTYALLPGALNEPER
jgi:hypothetical protein